MRHCHTYATRTGTGFPPPKASELFEVAQGPWNKAAQKAEKYRKLYHHAKDNVQTLKDKLRASSGPGSTVSSTEETAKLRVR